MGQPPAPRPGPAFPTQAPLGGPALSSNKAAAAQINFRNSPSKAVPCSGSAGGGGCWNPHCGPCRNLCRCVFRVNKGFQVCQEMPDSKETR